MYETSNSQLVIKKLIKRDYNQINEISEWMFNWWGCEEGYSKEDIKVIITHSINENKYPKTYGIFLKEEL